VIETSEKAENDIIVCEGIGELLVTYGSEPSDNIIHNVVLEL
jgi:hypothetical protein